MEYILFDLDGTISESAPGITQSVQYALSTIGISEPDLSKLEHFVGPPLNTQFQKSYGVDETTAKQLVDAYREFYNQKGIFACKMYPGMYDLIHALKEKHLGICSSKPKIYVEKILEHFGILDCFSLILAPGLDHEKSNIRMDKPTMIQMALSTWQVDGHSVCMVGDRIFDVEGAKANSVQSIGVLYGYGTKEELSDADILVKDVFQLAQVLL